jgi:hypothetical protein
MFTRDPVVLEELKAKQEAKAEHCRTCGDPERIADARKHERVAQMIADVIRDVCIAEGYQAPPRDSARTPRSHSPL